MKTFWRIVVYSFLVFFFSWLFVHELGLNKLSMQSEDTLPAVFIPLTIIKHKTLYVDEYYNMIISRYPHPDDKSYEKGLTPFYLKKIVVSPRFEHGPVTVHYASAFPIITGLLAIPVYLFPVLLNIQITFFTLAILAHISSSLIVSFSGGFFYLLLRKRFSLDEKKALIITLVYLFGSVNYAMVSQALWQHGTVQLFTILSLIFLFSSFSKNIFKNKLKFLFISSLFLGFAILSRPTAIIVAFFLFFLVVGESRSLKKILVSGLFYALGFIPPILFFIWYNSAFYKSVSNQGYSSQVFTNWLGKFPEGFLGIWLSPSKGILIYSPIFVFSMVGLFLVLRNGLWRKNLKYVIFACIVVVHTLLMGSWKHWFGGWSFGYRMASDILPFLTLLIVPYVSSIFFEKTKKVFIFLLTVSILIQISGIVFFDGIWHAAYDTGYKNTSWLWSIKDSETLFNVRRVLVKVGLLTKACPQCAPSL